MTALGFPPEFAERGKGSGEILDQSIGWLKDGRPASQNHWPALVLALLAQAEQLLTKTGEDAVPDVFAAYPAEEGIVRGKVMNTLNFTVPEGESIKLRPIYGRTLIVIRNQMLRNHPSNAPHATQSWQAYRTIIKQIYAMDPGDRLALAKYVWETGVIAAPEMKMAEVRERVIRPFEFTLANIPTSVPGIRGGALLQALTYGYLLADSPNLILESHKVNTGSSRTGMLGDVDGFRGSEPELAAEVKDKDLDELTAEADLGDFLEDIAMAPNATAVVVCRSMTDGAKKEIESRNVTVLTVSDLVRTVGVWDLPKQHEALRGVDYFLGRIQQDTKAVDFFRNWLSEHDLDGGLSVPSEIEDAAGHA